MAAKLDLDGSASPANGPSALPRMKRARQRLLKLLSPGATKMSSLPTAFAPFLAWRERNFAAARSREMLALYWTVASRHPDLTGLHLYRKIVAARSCGTAVNENAVLDCAEQSFTDWPVSRELKFRDVVHCIAVLEFLETHKDAHGIQANLRPVVNAIIPSGL
jgi:hypothetical protein